MFQGDIDMSLNEMLHYARVQWHGTELFQPDWSDESRTIAFTIRGLGGRHYFHMILNAYWEVTALCDPAQTGRHAGVALYRRHGAAAARRLSHARCCAAGARRVSIMRLTVRWCCLMAERAGALSRVDAKPAS